MLLRFPALFAAIAVAALLLALATASGPLFVSSAASSALADELEDATRFGAGASIVYHGAGARLHPLAADANEGIDRLNHAVLPGLRGVPHLDPPVFTVLGTTVTPGTAPGPSSQRPLRLLARTGALAHVQKLAGRDGDGVWIADEAAESMRLEAGDDLYLNYDDGVTRKVSIDGIYRALWKEPRTPYWRSLTHFIYGEPDPGPPPAFLIGEREQVVALSRPDAGLQLRWEWPVDSAHLTLDEADGLERRLRLFQQRTEELATRLRAGASGFRAPQMSYSSLLATVISTAKERASTVRGPADLLTAAAVLVAVAVVGAAAAFALARRRVEATVLFARGAAPGEIGARGAVEALLPVLVGTLGGFGLAVALTAAVGPGAVARSALGSAAKATGLAIPGAALLIGLVSALVFAFSRERHSGRPLLPWRPPWEIPVLAAAAFFLYELRSAGAFAASDGGGAARPSLSVILFPLLFFTAVSGLAARQIRRAFGRLRAASSRFPAAPYLAVRRLASAGRLTVLLATASAVSLGTFVYAQAVARSLEETVEAKSLLFVGSDVNGLSDYDREVPDAFPLPATMVTKLAEGGELDGAAVDVMVIDPTTFAATAYFDKSWADEPVDEIVRGVERERGGRLPVVLAGGRKAASTLELEAVALPIEVVEQTRAFPGMSLRRPLVVADRAMFERAVARSGAPNPLASAAAETQIWVKGETSRAVRALQSSSLRPFPIVTAEQVREIPTIRSVTQTFSYLKALGLAAGLLALAGAVLYLQARNRTRVISYALARRMGLAPGKHRLALGLELGTLLISSFTIGAFLAVLAARVVIVELDAPAELPAGPLFRTPWVLMGAALLGLVGASAAGALIADRRARRANLAEVIRAGE